MDRFGSGTTGRAATWKLALVLGVAMAMLLPSAAVARIDELIADGNVYDSGSFAPLEGAWVNAYRVAGPDWYWAGDANTNAAGDYAVYDTMGEGAGDYVFTADAYGHLYTETYRHWNGPGSSLTVDFGLDSAKPIASGKVTDMGTGIGIADAYVAAAWFDGTDYWLTGDDYTAPDGTYTVYDSFDRGIGQYELYVEAGGYVSQSKYVTWTGTKLTANFALSSLDVVGIAGANRIATSIEISKKAFPGGADDVVIATGYNWPDALGGSALAGALDGPILLTRQDRLPSEVLAEITRLKAKNAVILGSAAAVSTSVENALKSKLGAANVTRLGGDDRYETARKIAAETVRILKLTGGYGRTAFVATGANFPDALGASPLAAAEGWPIFLVNPRTGVDAATISAMQALKVEGVLVLGDKNAVSDTSKNLITSGVPCATQRLSGANRYATAIAVASYGVSHGSHIVAWDRLAIATGTNFPDALAGGVLQGRDGAVLLLTPGTWLHPAVEATLSANKAKIDEVRFFGDTNAVSAGVRSAVVRALQ